MIQKYQVSKQYLSTTEAAARTLAGLKWIAKETVVIRIPEIKNVISGFFTQIIFKLASYAAFAVVELAKVHPTPNLCKPLELSL